MKSLRKIMALLIAMVMVIGMSVSVFAEEGDHTITIAPVANQNGVHTYTAYKILSGKYDSSAKNLSDIEWANGVNGTSLLSSLKTNTAFNIDNPAHETDASAPEKVNAFASANSASDVAKILGENQTFANDFADAVSSFLSTAAGSASNSNEDGVIGNAVITVNGDGYYFVKDTTASMPDGDAFTDYILQVLDNVSITTKSGTTSSDKKVDDNDDDKAADNSEWIDSADYNIGDTVPFKLSATVAADYGNYKAPYKLTFHDTMDNGLSFDDSSVVVKVDDSTITSGYTLIKKGGSGIKDTDCTFEIQFTDLKTIDSVVANSVITVEFKAKLNENAVPGQAGNKNTSHVTFSNNPNNDQGGENGKTPDDTVIVFTYQAVFNKVTGTGSNATPLTGADFTLYKKVNDAWVNVTELNGAGKTNPSKTKSANKGVADSVFTFKGLDAGDYKIEETTTPSGYNSISPIEFAITATHDILSDDPKLQSLATTGGLVLTGDTATGTLTTNIENEAGATLPSTGGIGTTIFYVLGAVLVIGAGVILIARRKVNA